jgi:large subunit ribosomal protein L2
VAIKIYKPTSPGRRGMTGQTFEEITKVEPEKALVFAKKRQSGRNNQGRITVRHRGGGTKPKIRVVDFARVKSSAEARVAAIEYDPGRTARIALVQYSDGEKKYIIAPAGLNVGDAIRSGGEAEIRVGHTLPLRAIPSGTPIHNIEMEKGKGAKLVRSAGVSAQLMAKEGNYALVRLPSGEMRRIQIDCLATIGQVGNIEHQMIKLGKAGATRHRGIRPSVRGSAMTPRDHPHGGGEGRTPIGLPGPKTPWGKPARGHKTRKPKASDKMIVKRREK